MKTDPIAERVAAKFVGASGTIEKRVADRYLASIKESEISRPTPLAGDEQAGFKSEKPDPELSKSEFHKIKPGSRVTIMTPHGQEATGKVVMRGPAGWVLNMGGPHGRPGIATPENVVRVK